MATVDPAFEAEARRQGRIILHRQRLFAVPLLVFALLLLASLFLVPHKAFSWAACACIVLLPAGVELRSRLKQRLYPYAPTVRCPTCTGLARIEDAEAPDRYYYLVCSKCGQRATTRLVMGKYPFYASGDKD